jgi:hypothetical protein
MANYITSDKLLLLEMAKNSDKFGLGTQFLKIQIEETTLIH